MTCINNQNMLGNDDLTICSWKLRKFNDPATIQYHCAPSLAAHPPTSHVGAKATSGQQERSLKKTDFGH